MAAARQGIQHSQRPEFQAAEWRVQRVAYWLPPAIVLLAATGVLGGDGLRHVLNATAVYFGLLVLFRIVGKRTLAQITTFDAVLVLIIAEATQGALIGNDNSVTGALVVISTLATVELGLSAFKQRFRRLEPVLDGLPVILVENGQVVQEHLDRERVDIEDILAAAREHQGVGTLEEIHFAVLERSGRISIVPHN